MGKNLFRFLVACAAMVLLVGHAIEFVELPFVTRLDAYLYDARLRFTMPRTVDERVVIVDIDEPSLAEVGRWPWNRDIVAKLVRRLVDEYRVTVVGFDVVFAEPDTSSGLPILEKLGQTRLQQAPAYQSALKILRKDLDYDQIFADTLRGRPVVLGFTFTDQERGKAGNVIPQPAFVKEDFVGQETQFLKWPGFSGNLAILQEAAAAAGHFTPMIDSDGMSRRVPLFYEYRGAYYEALSLAVLRQVYGRAGLRLGFPSKETSLEWVDVLADAGSLRIPVDAQSAAMIPYRGPERSFPYLSAVDVLQGRVPVEKLRGKVILVGTSALGLKDLRATPVGGSYPGVEIHANLIAGMLDGQIKSKPGYIPVLEALLLIVLGGALGKLLSRASPVVATMLTLLFVVLYSAFDLYLWSVQQIVLPLASGILLFLFLYVLNMFWGYFVESRAKRQFAELFGQYVPPELVDEMARDPESYSMAGRSEILSVLFSDIRGFTSISEALEPRDLVLLLNEYLGAMTEVIRQQRGTLDKYIGDAIMAFWGAPVSDAEHATHALRTALTMQRVLRDLNPGFKARGWPELAIGIGVNSGLMTVGDMGSVVRKAYTVMGDSVNLAARLEGLTKYYGVGIIVGESTRLACPQFVFRELDRVRVKGKDEPTAIFEPLGLPEELDAAVLLALEGWEGFLQAYRAQQWDVACGMLIAMKDQTPDCLLYSLYMDRIDYLRANPPGGDWDGVTTFETK